jgi:Na(+)-translocating NADH:ubiquinone oxidoreductase F subunit
MIWIRKLHKWIGLAVGIQVAIWMLSGLLMGLLDHDRVQGHHTQTEQREAPLSAWPHTLLEPGDVLDRMPRETAVHSLHLVSFLDRPVYRIASDDKILLFDSLSGRRVEITADVARRVARTDYSGRAEIRSVTAVRAPSMEVRRHEGPAWRVDFDDADDTSLYVSANDGSILERRNDTWRLFDVFWMLHIMDYQQREDFNNALVILVSLIAAWFSISGLILFFDSFRREDFLALLPGTWWRKRAGISVCAPHGEVVTRIASYAGGRLYDELAKGSVFLPSNCGGGGTCGLCEVTLGAAWPESPADLRLIPDYRRQQGVRLSCQAKVADNMVVGISDEVLSAKSTSARVATCRFVTPFIREIALQVDGGKFDYPAGSYVHVVIPPRRSACEIADVTDEVRSVCARLKVSQPQANKRELRRAYSLATASEDNPGLIVLNVRFMVPPENKAGAPAGAGSSHMWSLGVGDQLDIVGPLGDFRARDTGRDMIVIGGGAGMAPLRAIIRSELLYRKSGRRIDFWYGGRSRKDLLYATEFDELQAQHGNFRWQPALSEPLISDNWCGPRGYVHAVAHEELLNGRHILANCEFYICGPPPMLAASRQMLAGLGVPETRVFFDDFGI